MQHHEPNAVEWDESEMRRAPMPRWARGCCALYFVGSIVLLAVGGYALLRWLSP